MPDYYEIDFRQVHTAKSGDAIAIRYQVGNYWTVHLVDGGYSTTAPELANFIRNTYGTNVINHVVVTHPDRDHAEGLAPILEEFEVETLWMLGARIGAFTVLTPSPARYLQLVIQSEKAPKQAPIGILSGLMQAAAPALRFIKAGWGSEKFSSEPTSVENEMSVIQYALLCGDKIVLTGDAGRDGLTEAANFAPTVGLFLRGVDKFQAPHHGGRHNLSTEVLDRWVGPRLPRILPDGQELFTAIISSAKEDPQHPRKAVVRALRHRGAFVLTTEDRPCIVQRNSTRTFTPVPNVPYPDEQEED
jgi:beta-lactamase superfamily II metal-dependent hydrolase